MLIRGEELMGIETKREIKNIIELWLEGLGYNFDFELYSQVVKMSYDPPSYKVIADVTLRNIKMHSPTLSPSEAWRYTTKFVNGMKSNMISNNNYFQSVFKNGLFNPFNNEQNKKINLFNVKTYGNNDYKFLKDLWVDTKKHRKMFDFTIIVNGLPLVLIELVDKKNSDSFEEAFFRIEEAFDNFPMFFNFNKLILLTDGTSYKLGTLYDFPEDYIDFSDEIEGRVEGSIYSRNMLEEILVPENIIKYLRENKDINQVQSHIKESLKEEAEIASSKNLNGSEVARDEISNKSREIEQKNNIKKRENLEENDELFFLASIFKPDLNEIIESKDFKEKLGKLEEVPDFKENKAYIEDIQKNKDLDTLETFIKANERLVIKEVYKYIGYETISMDYDDMYQYGCIGLLKAMERFDLEKENEFSTYAIHWIRQSIVRGINNESLLIRVPVHRWDAIIKLRDLEYKSNIYFGKVDYNWISKELGESKEKVMELFQIRNSYMSNVSLDTPVGAEENTTLGELIVDENYDVEGVILDADLKKKIEESLDTVDDRSKDILIRRFGLNGKEPMTLEEIGDIYNVTRERIRQIEAKTLGKLRHSTKSKKLKEYCEG